MGTQLAVCPACEEVVQLTAQGLLRNQFIAKFAVDIQSAPAEGSLYCEQPFL